MTTLLIKEQVRGEIRFDEPLAPHTSLKVGGKADVWFEPVDLEDLTLFLKWAHSQQIPLSVLGNGSNLLVRDRGVKGAVLYLKKSCFRTLERRGDSLFCGSGVSVNELIHTFKQEELSGGEFLVGIPASVGGLLRMNAGAQGSDMSQIVEEVTYLTLDGELVTQQREELVFLYRNAPDLKDKIIVSALFRFQSGKREVIQDKLNEFSQRRAAVTPPFSSAGCIFKNPEGYSAGQLIDETGLKGLKVGQAMVSREHGNYFVNLGDATAQNFLDLIKLVQEKVKQVHGVNLETEVQIVGEA